MTDWHPPTDVLRVDLGEGTVGHEAVPEGWRRRFLGGKGLGARYLYELLEPGVDPLGPDNVLALMVGPLSGHLPGEVRYAAVTKSPLTGVFLDSYAGGSFAAALAGALYPALGVVVEGAADRTVRLVLEGGTGRIEPATDWWGLDATELADAAADGAVAGPGPAGEAGVKFATIASDGGEHHAGRGGAGAVMGAKRLKAIVARGSPPTEPSLEAVRERYEARFEADHRGRWHRSGGTVETIDAADAAGVLPTGGWRAGRFKGATNLGIEAIRARADRREGDGRSVPGDFHLPSGVVPRGALAISLGANLGIDDFDAVETLGGVCDALGLDVIEAGNAVAWAMLAAEAGVIDRDVDVGDAAAARRLLEEIARRGTPLGEALADGIDAASARFGGEDLIPTVKSMAAATYEPRPAPSMALAYATSDRGACHRRSRPVFEEALDATPWDDADRVEAVVAEQNLRSVLWCLVVDDVAAPAFVDDLGAAYLEAAGLAYTTAELETLGERVWTLTRLFNVREGVRRADDALPAAFARPLEGDGDAGAAIDLAAFDRLLGRYYAARRWDHRGVPTRAALEDLGLADVPDAATPVGDRPAGDRQP